MKKLDILIILLMLITVQCYAVPDIRLQNYEGYSTIINKGIPVFAQAFLSDGQVKYNQEFTNVGGHVYSFSCTLGFNDGDRFDSKVVDAYFDWIISVDPQALLIPRIGVDAPSWWQKANPDELVVFDDGTKGGQSFASDKWLQDISKEVDTFVRYLKNCRYSDRILALHFAGGYSAEWQSWGLWDNRRGDFSQPFLGNFRKFLQDKYKTDANLKIAWNNPDITFDTAQVPTRTARESEASFLYNPATSQNVIDFYEFYPQPIANAMLEISRVARTACDNKYLVGFFYGYMAAYGSLAVESQHLAFERVLKSPNVDFLCSPANYAGREPGGTSTFMAPYGCVNANGKYWFNEADIRTWLQSDPTGRCATYEETVGVLKREFGHMLATGTGLWWFDMSGGWFDDSRIMNLMGQMQTEGDTIMNDPELGWKEFPEEIAVILDPQSYYRISYTSSGAGAFSDNIIGVMNNLPRLGAPANVYTMADLPKLTDRKVFLFLNAYDLTRSERDFINTNLKTGNKTLIWCYAPGYGSIGTNGNVTESVSTISDLTGITTAKQPSSAPMKALISSTSPYYSKLGNNIYIGGGTYVAPSFEITDSSASVIARYTDTNKVCAAEKQFPTWKSVYISLMGNYIDLLREIARSAGVFIYSSSNDCYYMGRGTFTIHSSTAGTKIIIFPEKLNLTEICPDSTPLTFSDRNNISFTMNAKETKVFKVSRVTSSTPITIMNITVTNIKSDSAKISWATDLASTSEVYYGLQDTDYSGKVITESTTTHSVIITGLNPSTTYHFKIKSSAYNKKSAISSDRTFTTVAIPVDASKITNIKVSNITVTSAVVEWETDVPSDSVVYYGYSTGYTLVTRYNEYTTNHSVTIYGLSPDTVWHFKVSSSADGYPDAVSGDQNLRTLSEFKTGLSDISITNIRYSMINPTSYLFEWTTNVPGTSMVLCGKSQGIYDNFSAWSPSTTKHSLDVGGLEPNTVYHVVLKSYADGRNPGVSPDFTFMTVDTGEQTNIYCNGAGGYYGSEDTTISQSGPTQNAGSIADMYCAASTSGQASSILIKFRNLNLPVGVRIKSAILRLYAIGDNGGDGSIGIYGLLKNFNGGRGSYADLEAKTGEASWTYCSRPSTWASPGANGSTDRRLSYDSSLNPNSNSYVEFDVTTSLTSQYNSHVEYGWILRGISSSGGAYFWSSDYADESKRPQLRITYTTNIPVSSPSNFIKKGWNLISLPSDPVDGTPETVFSGVDLTNASLQLWDNSSQTGGGYLIYKVGWNGPMKPGEAYWLVVSGDRTVSYSAKPVDTLSKSLVIPAHPTSPYWAMTALPLTYSLDCSRVIFSVEGTVKPWSDAVSAGWIEAAAQGFDAATQSYFSASCTGSFQKDFLEPWFGYWMLIKVPDELTITFQ